MSANRSRVLLVEGDADEAEIVKRHLSASADSPDLYAVKSALRISTACRLLLREEFDIVILDIKVPQNVGLEGFTRIRQQRPELPVILLAGLQDEALARQAVRLGAQDFLIKGTLDCVMLKRAMRDAIKVKHLENMVEGILNLDSVAKLIVDADAVVLYANPAAEALLGSPAKQLAGKPFAYPRGSAAQPANAAAEMSVAAIEWNGEPARLVSLIGHPSVTRPEASDERRRLDGIKTEFTRRLSHELRNTMSTVKTAVFCLADPLTGPLTARQGRFVDMISRNVDRQARVFDKIADLARFEAGKLKLNLARVDLTVLLEEFAREQAFRSAESSRLTFESPAALPAVNGDADLILQVLRNLVDNAFRFAKSKVVVKACADAAGGVRVTVCDDGKGIAKSQLHDLFTPFSELDKRKGGVGFKGALGLTMSREIVDGHQGRIWAESDDKGSRFSFTLPVSGESEAKPGEKPRERTLIS